MKRLKKVVDSPNYVSLLSASMSQPIANLLTVNQAAARLGLTAAAVYLAIDEGRMDFRMVLGRIAVPASAVKKFKQSKNRPKK